MRPPRPKIHILDCDEPLLAFHDLTVRCGVTLRNAVMKFSAAEDMSEYFLTPLNTCYDCAHGEPIGIARRHYIYGLVEGEEEKSFHSRELEEVAA